MSPDQADAVGRWFPLGTPVSSTRKLISSSSFHRLDMTLAAAEALNHNKPNQTDFLLNYAILRNNPNKVGRSVIIHISSLVRLSQYVVSFYLS